MNKKEEEQILNRLANSIEKLYHHPSTLVWRGLLFGLMSGLGATIGVALVLTLIGYIIRSLGGLPVVGEWLINVERSLPYN